MRDCLLGLGLLSLSLATPAWAESVVPPNPSVNAPDRPAPATTVEQWQAQIAQSLVQVTGVALEPTETGFNLVLNASAPLAVPTTRVEGNALIAEIDNAVLTETFEQANPTAEIAQVSVVALEGDRIQVTITGVEGPPTAEISAVATGLSVAVTAGARPTAEEEDEVEITVTADREEERGYRAPNSSVGTKTDTPLRDVPQSIQVIPQQVIEDQGETSFNDALRNVSGISQGGFRNFAIRGFLANENILTDGSRNDRGGAADIQGGSTDNLNLDDVEQIEVLKGPASVLYGSGEPGGSINITTKQPSKEASYTLRNRIGNFSFYRPSIDFTGPLNKDKSITYRLNAFYENSESFVDFVKNEAFAFYPVLRFDIGENTALTLEGSYRQENGIARYLGLPTRGTVLPNPNGEIPISRFLGEPSYDRRNYEEYSIGYRLEHKFNDNWSIKNRFRFNSLINKERLAAFDGLAEDGRTALRTFVESQSTQENYNVQTDVIGKVKTGIVEHNLLFGAEFNRGTGAFRNPLRGAAAPLDIFAPVYGDLSSLGPLQSNFDAVDTSTSFGIYGQNLLAIGKKVKILLGGRYDWSFLSGRDNITGETFTEDPVGAFSPRIGIVYQPIEPVSLYANFSRSFLPSFGVDRLGDPFKPVIGQQFEAGVKGEFFNGKASATLAAFNITRRNDFVPDPVDPDNFSIQIGEIRSRGIEFDLSGEPLPGLRLIATYALTDSEITEDTRPEFAGERTINVPLHSGSLWAVYEVQKGSLQGLGLGSGVFVVGERVGNFPGATGAEGDERFTLNPYARIDALLYYRRDNWKVQLNIENLLSTNYIESSFGNTVFVGAPFTIRGQFSVTF